MYCERCGRELKDGEICSCKRGKKKGKWNGLALVSVISMLLGIALCLYFRLSPDNLLDRIPMAGIQKIKEYLYAVLPATVFLLGIIMGITAVLKKTFKVVSRMALIGNIVGLAVMVGFAGLTYFQNYQIQKLITGEVTSETVKELAQLYKKETDETVKKQIEEKMASRTEIICDSFNREELTYEKATEELENIKSLDIVSEKVEEVEEKVEKLSRSKEWFKEAKELEADAVQEAVNCYRKVEEEDLNYETAQQKITELLEKLAADGKAEAEKYAKESNYPKAIAKLETTIAALPEDEELQELKQKYEDAYVEETVKSVDSLIEERKFDEAKVLLDEAIGIISSEVLKEKWMEIDGYKPETLEVLNASNGYETEEIETLIDSYGNSYTDAVVFDEYSGESIVYQLGGKYSRFTAKLVAVESCSSDAKIDFAIFTDDVLAYQETGYTRQSGERVIDINLSGVQEMVVQLNFEGYDGRIALVESSVEKAVNAVQQQKQYERLADNVIIDSDSAEASDQMLEDSYGNLYSGYLEMEMYYGKGYILYNLNGKYAQFVGKIVTSGNTHSEASIDVQIYLDEQLKWEKRGITKTTEPIPISIDVTGGKVLKIVSQENNLGLDFGRRFYITDDRLYFESVGTTDVTSASSGNENLGQHSANSQNGGVTLSGENTGGNGTTQNDGVIIFSDEASAGAAGGNQTTTGDGVTILANGTATAAADESGIHRYEYYFLDDTWERAFQECIDRGGHLVRFNTQEEYEYVLDQIDTEEFRHYQFYIGGRRDLGQEDYCWVDNANAFSGEKLNDPNVWCSGNWMKNEPSFEDDSLDLEEHVMNLFYYKGENRWVWNDVPNNLPDAIPENRGKIGYICEFEN